MNLADMSNNLEADVTTTTSKPAYPPLPVADYGQVWPGGQVPLSSAANIADFGLVRLGGQSPTF